MASHAKDGWFDAGGQSPPAEDPGGDGDTFEATGPAESSGLLDEAAVYESVGEMGEVTASGHLDQVAPDQVRAERDEYRDALLRVKADFDNYRKRTIKDQATTTEQAAGKLAADLLPVLDACEAALSHGAEDVEPIYKSLVDVLDKGGLTRMMPEGQPFDPNLHEAVLHEEGDEGETVVIESLRTGYLWHGRVIRPAMVKVRG
jgi:molecular chaperone GrpE